MADIIYRWLDISHFVLTLSESSCMLPFYYLQFFFLCSYYLSICFFCSHILPPNCFVSVVSSCPFVLVFFSIELLIEFSFVNLECSSLFFFSEIFCVSLLWLICFRLILQVLLLFSFAIFFFFLCARAFLSIVSL